MVAQIFGVNQKRRRKELQEEIPPKISILQCKVRGGSRTAATSKMECSVIIVNGFQPLTIITKRSILDVAAVLDPPLKVFFFLSMEKYRKLYTIFALLTSL